MKRIAIIIAYDGTAYSGFQKQKNALTIEEVLNRSISELTGEDIHIIGASRTDAGVHALGNTAVFDTCSKIPAEKMAFAINNYLPEDIRIISSHEENEDFHPRYHNCTKTYEYRIMNTRVMIPQERNKAYFYHRKLDIDIMQKAAGLLIGEHDFTAFCSSGGQSADNYRTIYDAVVRREGDFVIIKVVGNGFLYNMVRIIAGSLIAVGSGSHNVEWFEQALTSKDRSKSGDCAPACGLTLISIDYHDIPDQLLINNDDMMYMIWQKEIRLKAKSYITFFYCRDEILADNIIRLTKKQFRYGAGISYLRFTEGTLPGILKKNKNEDSFTVDAFKYELYGDVIRMDRDLRANPSEPCPEEFKVVKAVSISDTIDIYNKCFFSVPCAISMDEENFDLFTSKPTINVYNLKNGNEIIGMMILEEEEDSVKISAMCILGTYRRKGYAGFAIEHTCRVAENAGKKRVSVEVHEKNKKAVNLYISKWFYRISSMEHWYYSVNKYR